MLRLPIIALVLLLAQGTVLADNPPLAADSRFKVEQFAGPVIGSSRVIGLAGAYVSIAETAVGIPWNPASVANRTPHSNDWFDMDLTFDYLAVGVGQGDSFDFDNNDRSPPNKLKEFLVLNGGGMLQFGAFGVGAYVQGNLYDFEDESSPPRVFSGNLVTAQFSMGYAFWRHQLLLGGGFRLNVFEIEDKEDSKNKYGSTTTGVELSGLFRPRNWPLRIGFQLSMPASSTMDDDTSAAPTGFFLPQGVSVPWEFRFGASAKFFSKKLYNPTPIFLTTPYTSVPVKRWGIEAPGEESFTEGKKLAPEGDLFLLVSIEFLFIGRVKNSIGSDGFFEQVYEPSGRHVGFSPRIGMETEVLRQRLRIRSGFYWEPSRSDNYPGRLHWTVALQFRILDFVFFGNHSLCISTAIDVSKRYSNLCLGVGFWH